MKKLLLLAAAAALLAPQAYGKEKKTSAPASTIKVRNVLEPAAYGATHFGGYLGEKLDLCIDNRPKTSNGSYSRSATNRTEIGASAPNSGVNGTRRPCRATVMRRPPRTAPW